MCDLFVLILNYLLETNAKQGERRKFVMSGAMFLYVFIPGGPNFAHIQSVKSPQTPWSYFSGRTWILLHRIRQSHFPSILLKASKRAAHEHR